MTEVPQIYQPDDPRQGLLGTLIGDSDWKFENQFGGGNKGNQYDANGKLISTGEGSLGKEEGNEYGTYTQREAERTEQEPGTYNQNTHRANAGGLLNSGVNSTRINNIAQHFANQRFNTTKAHTEATQRFGTQRSEGQHGHEADVNTKLAEGRINAWNTDQEKKAAAAAAAQTGLAASNVGTPTAPNLTWGPAWNGNVRVLQPGQSKNVRIGGPGNRGVGRKG